MPTAAIWRFERFLQESEQSPATIKNYRGDLRSFAERFKETSADKHTPQKITPTDLREFKKHIQDGQNLRTFSVNRKLATLKSFLS